MVVWFGSTSVGLPLRWIITHFENTQLYAQIIYFCLRFYRYNGMFHTLSQNTHPQKIIAITCTIIQCRYMDLCSLRSLRLCVPLFESVLQLNPSRYYWRDKCGQNDEGEPTSTAALRLSFHPRGLSFAHSLELFLVHRDHNIESRYHSLEAEPLDYCCSTICWYLPQSVFDCVKNVREHAAVPSKVCVRSVRCVILWRRCCWWWWCSRCL